MARYRVDEAHYLGIKYVEAGSIVDWDGPPSRHMTPVEAVAEERKARYDAERPHRRRSRDLPPSAAILHDSMQRQPGTPRVAGPPGQIPGPSSDPANPERTADIVSARKEHGEMSEKAYEAALVPSGDDRSPSDDDLASPKPASGDAQPVRPSKPKPSK